MNIEIFEKVIYDAIGWIGCHPQKVVEADGTERLITEYQKGWNATIEKLSWKLYEQMENIKKEKDEDLLYLLEQDVGWLDEGRFILNRNDQFFWACADAEETEREDYPELVRLFKKYSVEGLVYWVSKKRGEEPSKDSSDYHRKLWEKIQEIKKQEGTDVRDRSYFGNTSNGDVKGSGYL